MIAFNKPYLTGNEALYINSVLTKRKLSGNGDFTRSCQDYFQKRYNFRKCLLTTSCTDALEMAAILCDIKPGDEVIVPSYTFVSTALAFVRQGATIIFADSSTNNPNIDVDKIERLITHKTKVIVPVHYAGIACDMDKIMFLAVKYNLLVVEDAAQSIDSYYKDRPLGSIGHLSAFSFHETKNIISGEGGMLVINDDRFSRRAEIIWEKGTNRAEFFRGEVNKYGWVDTGSSFLPSEILAAFLMAQIEKLDDIQSKRKKIWEQYFHGLKILQDNNFIKLPFIPDFATNNAHMFYIVCQTLGERTNLISFLRSKNISTVFHYLSLHKSEFYKDKYMGEELINSDIYTDCLLRLPMFYELSEEDVITVINSMKLYYAQ